jgi:hypothetical protein
MQHFSLAEFLWGSDAAFRLAMYVTGKEDGFFLGNSVIRHNSSLDRGLRIIRMRNAEFGMRNFK